MVLPQGDRGDRSLIVDGALQAQTPAAATPAQAPPALPSRTLWFFIEAINSLAATYFFNYIFFYMRDHYGFGNRLNLLLSVLYGGVYTVSAWNAGRFAQRFGYLFSLRVALTGTGLAMITAGLLPHFFGYSRATMLADCAILGFWAWFICLAWPTLQALLSNRQPAAGMPRTAGFYNIVWAATSAVAYLTGGALLQRIGGEILIWIAAGLHLVSLVILARLTKSRAAALEPARKNEGATNGFPSPPQDGFPKGDDRFAKRGPRPSPPLRGGEGEESQDVAPSRIVHPASRSSQRTFLYLAWLANPFAYMAINGILPVIPKLAERLGLDAASAGVVCSVWFWVRFGAFVWFWLWPAWHYRFRWLLAAFVTLAVSFTSILLSFNIWMLIAAQVAFGLAVGLIYYSSLFYSMDVGESRGRRGGFHEGAIGLGTCAGPAVGVIALQTLPSHPNAGTWAISTLLMLGLIPFLLIRRKGFR
jgi:MFS family permease